jgi:hypothetical protein
VTGTRDIDNDYGFFSSVGVDLFLDRTTGTKGLAGDVSQNGGATGGDAMGREEIRKFAKKQIDFFVGLEIAGGGDAEFGGEVDVDGAGILDDGGSDWVVRHGGEVGRAEPRQSIRDIETATPAVWQPIVTTCELNFWSSVSGSGHGRGPFIWFEPWNRNGTGGYPRGQLRRLTIERGCWRPTRIVRKRKGLLGEQLVIA